MPSTATQGSAMARSGSNDRKLLELATIVDADAFWKGAIEFLTAIVPNALAVVSWSHPLLVYSVERNLFLNAATSCEWALCSSYRAQMTRQGTGITWIDARTFTEQEYDLTPTLEAFGCEEATVIRIAYQSPSGRLGRTVSQGRTSQPSFVDILLYHRREQDAACRLPALEAVFGDFATVVAHFLRNSRIETLAGGIAGTLFDMPVAVIFLDANLKIQFATREALRQTHLWRYAPDRRIESDLRRNFRLPDDIYERLLELWFLRFAFEPANQSVQITHPADPDLKATISRIIDEHHPSHPPNYLVRFNFINPHASGETYVPSAAHLNVLAELSPAERTVAMMVLQGLTNQEVAASLHRQTSTVKDHLTNIYAKLGVANRVQLSRLLTSQNV